MKKLCLYFALAILLFIALFIGEVDSDETAWNGGYCECGGSYEMSGATHSHKSGDSFYYSCNQCGDTIRTHHLMK